MSVFSGNMPEVYVRNITISPGQPAAVKLSMLIKEKRYPSGTPSWHHLVDLTGNTYIYVVQCRSASESAVLGSLLKDVRSRIFNIDASAKSVHEALTSTRQGTEFKKINLREAIYSGKYSGATRNVSDLSVANKEYDVLYETDFDIVANNLDYLSYYIFSHIDIRGVEESLDVRINGQAEIGMLAAAGSRLKKEAVLVNGAVPEMATVFIDSDTGMPYLGEKHQSEAGWTKGLRTAPEPGYLEVRQVRNTKVNDLRAMQLPPVQERYYGGTVYTTEADILKQRSREQAAREVYMDVQSLVTAQSEQSTEMILKNRVLNADSVKNPYRGEILFSTAPEGGCRYLFTIDWHQMLITNSQFSQFFRNLSADQLRVVMRASAISSFKLWRRRVCPSSVTVDSTPTPLTGINSFGMPSLEVFDANESPTLIVLAVNHDSGGAFEGVTYPKSGDRVGTVSEIFVDFEELTDEEDAKLRTFTGTDYQISDINDGAYQYYIELEIIDGMYDLTKRIRGELDTAIVKMVAYYNLASIPRFREASSSFYERGGTGRKEYGNYDTETGLFTKKFLETTAVSNLTHIRSAVRSYSAAIKLMMGVSVSSNKLEDYVNPLSNGTLETLGKFMEMLKQVRSMYEDKVLSNAKSVRNSKDSGSRTSSSSADTRRYKVLKYFNHSYNCNNRMSFGAKYFNSTLSSTPGFVIQDMSTRLSSEYLSYGVENYRASVNNNGAYLSPSSYVTSEKGAFINSDLSNRDMKSRAIEKKAKKKAGERSYEQEPGPRLVLGSTSTRRRNFSYLRPRDHRAGDEYKIEALGFDVQEDDSLRFAHSVSKSSSGIPWVPKGDKSEDNTNTELLTRRAAVFSSISSLSNVGMTVESPLRGVLPIKMLSWLSVEDENIMTKKTAKNLSLSVTGSGVNEQLKVSYTSPDTLSDKEIQNGSMISNFIYTMSNVFSSNSLSESVRAGMLPSISVISSYVEDRFEYSDKELKKQVPLPPQIEKAALLGRSAPGVLPGGRFSEFVQGMVMSVEVKSSTQFSFVDAGKLLTQLNGPAISISTDNQYRKLDSSDMPPPSRGNPSSNLHRKYRICRLVPYKNENLGFEDNNIRNSTTVFDEYFLVEVG